MAAMTESTMMSDTLPLLRQQGLLNDLDLHFAGLMIRLAENSDRADTPPGSEAKDALATAPSWDRTLQLKGAVAVLYEVIPTQDKNR